MVRPGGVIIRHAFMTLGSSSMVGGWGASGLNHRLHAFVKRALLQQLVPPGAIVCDLFCGRGMDTVNWAQAEIGAYIGIDLSSSALEEAKEQWEQQGQPFPATFRELDPCMGNLAVQLKDSGLPVDVVSCLAHLQDCFTSEDMVRRLLRNVVSLLKPGGYFFGTTPDSSTIWYKYQKAVEDAMKVGSLRVNGTLPRVRSPLYQIIFEDDRFQFYGSKYQLRFVDGLPTQVQLLVHFPSLIRLAEEVGLEYVEIQNLTEFYDDYRLPFSSILQSSCKNLLDQKGLPMVDSKGRLSMVAIDVLSLYSTFIFKKSKHATLEIPIAFHSDTIRKVDTPLSPSTAPQDKPLEEQEINKLPVKKKQRVLGLPCREDSPQSDSMNTMPALEDLHQQYEVDITPCPPMEAGPETLPDLVSQADQFSNTHHLEAKGHTVYEDPVAQSSGPRHGGLDKVEEQYLNNLDAQKNKEKITTVVLKEELVDSEQEKTATESISVDASDEIMHTDQDEIVQDMKPSAICKEVGCSQDSKHGKDLVRRRRSTRCACSTSTISALEGAGQTCSVNYQSEVEQEPIKHEVQVSVSVLVPPPFLFYQRKRRTPGAVVLGQDACSDGKLGNRRALRPRRSCTIGTQNSAPVNYGDKTITESSTVKQAPETAGFCSEGLSSGSGKARSRGHQGMSNGQLTARLTGPSRNEKSNQRVPSEFSTTTTRMTRTRSGRSCVKVVEAVKSQM